MKSHVRRGPQRLRTRLEAAVSHTGPVILALRALGETAGTADDAEHAGTCAHRRAELARLTDVVELARHDGPEAHLEAPPPQVWDRIAAAASVGLAPPTEMARRPRPRAGNHRAAGGDLLFTVASAACALAPNAAELIAARTVQAWAARSSSRSASRS